MFFTAGIAGNRKINIAILELVPPINIPLSRSVWHTTGIAAYVSG